MLKKNNKEENINISEKPTGISVIIRELKKDKIAIRQNEGINPMRYN